MVSATPYAARFAWRGSTAAAAKPDLIVPIFSSFLEQIPSRTTLLFHQGMRFKTIRLFRSLELELPSNEKDAWQMAMRLELLSTGFSGHTATKSIPMAAEIKFSSCNSESV